MEYTEQQIEGNVLQLIHEKVEDSMKDLNNHLVWLISSDSLHRELIPSFVESMMKAREDLYARYGVKPVRFGNIYNKEDKVRDWLKHLNEENK